MISSQPELEAKVWVEAVSPLREDIADVGRQLEFMAKHPPARSIPRLKVEVAEPVMSRAAACIPPAKVEVAVVVE